MNAKEIEVGDIIRIDRAGYQHVGVYVGSRDWQGRCVVHNRKADGVVLSRFEEFADGCPVSIHQKAVGNHFQREKIARQALALVGKKYDLFNFNCEHAANFAQNGKARSPQFAFWVLVALILGGFALLSRKRA